MGSCEQPAPEESVGQLEVSVRMARNLPHKGIVGKQSPFVQFELGKEVRKSACDKRGRPQPAPRRLTVKVFNKTLKPQSDYIGETTVDLDPILEEKEHDAWFTIRNRGEFAGDVYIEFTFHPAGMPRTNLNRSNSRIITEVEEGLSILSLKNLQRDPRIISADLPMPLAKEPKTTLPGLQPSHSSASLSSLSSTPDSQLAPANESDLTSILDEIRSLVDYPYHVPAEEQPPGPGALPPMRRKPLPQPPPVLRSQEPPHPQLSVHPLPQPPRGCGAGGPIPFTAWHQSTRFSHQGQAYTVPESPTGALLAKIRFSSDHDPASEIKVVSSTAKTIRRRPMEAPGALQSFAEPTSLRSPYAEDVRGRPIPFHNLKGRPPYGVYPPSPVHWVPRPLPYRPLMIPRPLPRPMGYRMAPGIPDYTHPPPIYYSPRPHYAPLPHPSPIPHYYPRPIPRPNLGYSPKLGNFYPQPARYIGRAPLSTLLQWDTCGGRVTFRLVVPPPLVCRVTALYDASLDFYCNVDTRFDGVEEMLGELFRAPEHSEIITCTNGLDD
ncbi:hypothetical protein L0F63_000542 [Massospora cicadina]|nr:hypothetical protein L0F63_000542 [Massospora cicadina]